MRYMRGPCAEVCKEQQNYVLEKKPFALRL